MKILIRIKYLLLRLYYKLYRISKESDFSKILIKSQKKKKKSKIQTTFLKKINNKRINRTIMTIKRSTTNTLYNENKVVGSG